MRCPPGFGGDLSGAGVRRILLTASGGPFRTAPLDQLAAVTPEQACAHPNWVMGRKISVDSATMMNKGLEVIEAHWLFGARPEQIEVVIHPQSVIHSMVEYVDGSVIAQLGNPDMRTPIAHALGYPERIESGRAPAWTSSPLGSARFRSAGPAALPLPGARLPGAAGRRQRGRSCSTPPTRSRSNSFLRGELPFNRIPALARGGAGACRRPPGRTAGGRYCDADRARPTELARMQLRDPRRAAEQYPERLI